MILSFTKNGPVLGSDFVIFQILVVLVGHLQNYYMGFFVMFSKHFLAVFN